MKIGFAIITDSPFFEQIIAFEHHFHVEGGFFDSLGSEKNLPHTTLFQGDMDEAIDYRSIADIIAEKFVRLLPDRVIAFDKIVYVPEGWYFLECRRDPPLFELHEEVLKLVRPHIHLDPARLDRDTGVMTREQIRGVQVYGYRYAGKAFYPHITIGRTLKESAPLLFRMNAALDKIERTSCISRITVYRMGPNGTHESTLYQVQL